MQHKTLAAALAQSLAGVQKKKSKRPDVVRLLREDARKRRRALAELDDKEDFAKAKEDSPDKLRVLVDPDAQKISMKVFEGYVSEEDYSRLVEFLKEFDGMLYKFRDGRPLEREEIEKIEEEYKDADGNGTDDDDEVEPVLTAPQGDMPADETPIDASDPDDEDEPEPAYVISELDNKPKSPMHNLLVNKFGLAEAPDDYQHSENHKQWKYVPTKDRANEAELPNILQRQGFERDDAVTAGGTDKTTRTSWNTFTYRKPNQELKVHVRDKQLHRVEHRITNPGTPTNAEVRPRTRIGSALAQAMTRR